MALFGTPSTPAGQATGFAFGSSFTTPQTPATGLFGGSASSGGGLFGSSTPAFGSPTPGFGSSTPAFGSSTPAFGSSTPAFGSSTPAFGSATPAFGSPTPGFGTPAFGSSTPGFGASTPAFGAASTSAFGANPFASSTPGFGSSTPGFGSSPAAAFGASTPAFGAPSATPSYGFGTSTPGFGFNSFAPNSSLFGSSGSSPAFGTSPSGFGFGQPQQPFGQPTSAYGQFNTGQLTTQMAPVAPLVVPLPEREVQAIAEAYKEDPGNTRYAFKHLLLSVMEPSERVKPPNVSDIMWAEAMSKLEAMDMEEREKLYPQLMLGFKDLSKRLQLQDEALTSDVKRLEATEANVKLLQRHFQIDTVPWIQRLRLKEQQLQRKMLKLMRIIEAMEAKGLRMPLTKAETHIGEKLRGLLRQLQPSSGELPRRAESVLSVSRLQAGVGGAPVAGQLHEQSLAEIQEVLRKQTEAISRLAAVLKRDMRDIEIMTDDGSHFLGMDIAGAAAVARSKDVFAMPAA